jgi:hypothetical protein
VGSAAVLWDEQQMAARASQPDAPPSPHSHEDSSKSSGVRGLTWCRVPQRSGSLARSACLSLAGRGRVGSPDSAQSERSKSKRRDCTERHHTKRANGYCLTTSTEPASHLAPPCRQSHCSCRRRSTAASPHRRLLTRLTSTSHEMSTANADEQPPSSAFTSPQPLSHIPILRSNASSAVVSPEPLGSIPISGSDAKSPSSNAQVQQAEETIRRPSFIAESISGLFLSNTPAASPVAASSDSSGSAADQPRGGARSRAGSLSGISGGLAMGLSGLTPSGSPVLTETAPGGTRSRSGSMSGVGGLAWAMGATGAAASAAASSGASTAAFSVPPSSMLLSVESPAATTTASTLAYPLGLSGLIHSGGLSSGRAASAASLALGVSPRGSVSSDENVPAAGLAASIAPSLATAAVSASAGPAASSSVRTARSWSLSLAASSASSASVGELPDVSSISHSQATGYTGRHSVGNAASVASASSEPPGLAASMRARLRGALRSTPSRSSEHKATEELQKEWSGIIARWNEYQLNGLAASSNLSASTLRDNQSRLTKLLLTHGIPSNLRPTVWMLLIGNTLGITPAQWRELKEESRRNRREYERWKRRVNNSNMGQAAAAAAAAAAASTQQHQSEQTSRSVTTASESSTDAPIGAVSPVSSPVAPLSPSTSSLPPHLSLFSLIDQDLPRTFPELKFFHVERQEQQSDGRGMDGEGGEGEHKEQQESEEGGYGDALKEVLECASLFRLKHASTLDGSPSNDPNSPPSSSTATVGYVQGMSFLASILLLSLGDDSFLVFLALANLLENPCERLSELFSMDAHATRGYLEQFQRQMGQSLPGLAQHFEQVGIQPDMYMFKCQSRSRQATALRCCSKNLCF